MKKYQCIITAVNIRAEVTTHADYVISTLGKSDLFVKTNLQKRCHRRLIMVCCSRMSLEHTTEKIASVSGPFMKWNSRKTIKSETRLPESCLNPRAYPSRHELNLAQHVNLDSCNRTKLFRFARPMVT